MENISEEAFVVDGISKDEACSYWPRSPAQADKNSSVLILLTAASIKARYL
jgi:hypothetical protein